MVVRIVTATCACATFSVKVNFPSHLLPADRALCLCSSCRRVSGSCGNSYIQLPPSKVIDPFQYNLSSYSTSEDLTRYFCSKCSAHVLVHRKSNETWHLATGIWDDTYIINWTGCKWVNDTKDGGVSVWFKETVDNEEIGEKAKLKRWMLRDGDGALVPEGTLEHLSTTEKKLSEGKERLEAQCHCGGVKFFITRPNEESRKVRSPFPDLMVPYNTGASSANPNNETWWLRSNDTKYLAGTCTCDSCRLSLGFEIQTWAFVPKCNIFQENGEGLDFKMGTLKTYDSSEGVQRESCGKCGATVFWHCKERPDLIDVSVGLFDPEEGARVEGWLEWWTERVSFEEMAVSTSLVQSLENGLKEWGRNH